MTYSGSCVDSQCRAAGEGAAGVAAPPAGAEAAAAGGTAAAAVPVAAVAASAGAGPFAGLTGQRRLLSTCPGEVI